MQSNMFRKLNSRISSKLNPRAITSKLRSLFRKLIQKVRTYATKFVQTLLKKPKDKSDYIKISGVYVSKRFIMFFIIGLILFIFVFVQYIFPWADGNLWTATIKVSSQKYQTFSGKARLKDNSGNVIYVGHIEQGNIEGFGTQYDLNGNVVYVGNFSNAQYSGSGELYYNGYVMYKGEFSQNLYNGEGNLLDENGNTIYSGSFENGQKSGKGIEYNTSTNLKKYYGDFANDLREGKGTEYDSDGVTILYEGDFKSGQYSGSGKLYQNATLKYDGEFSNGLYEGNGTLYDLDTKNILYIGEFSAGLYNGSGSLYDINTKKLIYNGEFESGNRKGTGELYDSLGSVAFNGDFRDDNIDYVSYIGQSMDEVKEQFGKESYKNKVSDRMVLTYLGLNVSIIFKEDTDAGTFNCEKFIMGTKYPFKGLGSKSSKEDVEAVMGESFSSINFKFPDYYDRAFTDLSIDLKGKTMAPSDKFLMSNYFIRFYYTQDKSKIKAIEVSTI